jgi:hypothetical protein
MNEIEFLNTFVGPCQHLRTRVIMANGWPTHRCTMQVSLRGISVRCNASRPLTLEEKLKYGRR